MRTALPEVDELASKLVGAVMPGAIIKDDAVNDADKRRVIPGLCRMALEAACKDIVYARDLGQGLPRSKVEDDWNDRLTTSQRVQAALGRDHLGVSSWLASRGKAKMGLGICTSGFHGGLAGTDPGEAVSAVQILIGDLRASA